MNKIAEMNIGLSKEELENLPPSEKHIVLNSLHDVKKNSDLVDEYLTEASHGESDETMSITCGDFFKVVEYYQGNLCIACFLPSFREIFRSDCVGKVYQSHENADEKEEDNGTDESGSVEITYDELNDLMALHVANIYLALTSEAFRHGEFAKCEAEACKSYLKHEVPGILKEIREQQEAEK